MDAKDLKQNPAESANNPEAENKTITPKKPKNKFPKQCNNGIDESEKNRPEAEASSPSIFDKSFEADSKK